MSKYIISSSGDDSYEPYKPMDNIDYNTGEIIESFDELKKRRGPFFSCDGAIHEPHFHKVDTYPYGNPSHKLNIEQLHVPGYDEHDTRLVPYDIDPYHSVTGWHIAIPSISGQDHHFCHFSAIKRFPKSTDNDEALSTWKDDMVHTYGEGDFHEEEPPSLDELKEHLPEIANLKIPTSYNFYPHKSEASDISFIPRVEYEDKVSPAIAHSNMSYDVKSPEEAKNTLIELANRVKESASNNLEKKIQESPNVWEDRFKQSKRIYTLDNDGKILNEQDYASNYMMKASKCNCSYCIDKPQEPGFW
jgi:hypothetical protein